jgi:hypothetical protein
MSAQSDSATTQNPWSSFGGTLANQSNALDVSAVQLQAFTGAPNFNQGTYLLGACTSNRVITLPPVAACNGVGWTFIASANATHTWTITPATSVLQGCLVTATPSVVGKAAAASVVFTATALAGDWVTLKCDGVNWYCSGCTSAAAGLS